MVGDTVHKPECDSWPCTCTPGKRIWAPKVAITMETLEASEAREGDFYTEKGLGDRIASNLQKALKKYEGKKLADVAKEFLETLQNTTWQTIKDANIKMQVSQVPPISNMVGTPPPASPCVNPLGCGTYCYGKCQGPTPCVAYPPCQLGHVCTTHKDPAKGVVCVPNCSTCCAGVPGLSAEELKNITGKAHVWGPTYIIGDPNDPLAGQPATHCQDCWVERLADDLPYIHRLDCTGKRKTSSVVDIFDTRGLKS